jgi:ectoine hydroxylase-related dioxygenase (phytanoyl-CoA dioxygenase family)
VLEGAVAPPVIDRFRSEIEAAWEKGDPRVRIEVPENGQLTYPRLEPRHRDRPHKVLDYHALSAAAREVQFAPAIRRFLGLLFERPPLAFQSLLFRWGTEQEMHQDTAYVVLRSPMEMVGCWIALEDVQPGSGELQYYVGSHRIPEYLWLGRARSRPPEFEDIGEFLRHVCVESQRLGCPLVRFQPRKGDALIWHADLVHGGSRREKPGVTRTSLVTHFCPLDVDPEWLGQVPSSPKLEHAPGCYYCYPLV